MCGFNKGFVEFRHFIRQFEKFEPALGRSRPNQNFGVNVRLDANAPAMAMLDRHDAHLLARLHAVRSQVPLRQVSSQCK